MNLLFRIAPQNLIDSYRRIVAVLNGNEDLIFDAMCSVAQNQNLAEFQLPNGPGEYEQKHREIESRLRRGRVQGRETAILLMEELLDLIEQGGGIPGISNTRISDSLFLETGDEDVIIRLGADRRWVAEWKVRLDYRGAHEEQYVAVEIHSRNWGEIVPTYVIEFISSALASYKRGMYATAVALLSVAVEAALRDVLVELGYSYEPRASSVDIYSYASARIGAADNSYTLTFDNIMPKSPAEFADCLDGQTDVAISIRRIIKVRQNGNRVDLHIRAPDCLIDHLSPDTIERTAQLSVSGLGRALQIARNDEQVITAEILPLDFEEVLVTVRNNLVHLSGATLDTELTMFSLPSPYTLQHFLDDAEMVFDFITSIPDLINSLYLELRRIQEEDPE